MLRMIEGPIQYLNVCEDWTYPAITETHMNAYNSTNWLFECAQMAVMSEEATWKDLGDADGILSTYPLQFKNDVTGEFHERELLAEDIAPRGVTLLNAAALDMDVFEWLMSWRFQIYEEIIATRRNARF